MCCCVLVKGGHNVVELGRILGDVVHGELGLRLAKPDIRPCWCLPRQPWWVDLKLTSKLLVGAPDRGIHRAPCSGIRQAAAAAAAAAAVLREEESSV